MTLADDMRAAADTLEKASERYGAAHPDMYHWTAKLLRNEAIHVQSEDDLYAELEQDLRQAFAHTDTSQRAIARRLYESGWRKGDPE